MLPSNPLWEETNEQFYKMTWKCMAHFWGEKFEFRQAENSVAENKKFLGVGMGETLTKLGILYLEYFGSQV